MGMTIVSVCVVHPRVTITVGRVQVEKRVQDEWSRARVPVDFIIVEKRNLINLHQM